MSFTNQDLINAFRDVFGRNTYWQKVLACDLHRIAERRNEVYAGPPIDDLPLWGRERREIAHRLSSVLPPGNNFDWPYGVCLAGLHGRADGRLTDRDYRAIAASGVSAVKLLSTASPEDSRALLSDGKFVMVRLFADLKTRRASPYDFLSWVVDDARRHYEAGVRYFEIHNEPNLRQEGWGQSWRDGAEFGDWWLKVRNGLDALYPRAKWGFPGLSPDGIPTPERTNDGVFLRAAWQATQAASFVCLHIYWQTADEMRRDTSLETYRRLFPDTLLFVTEFSNPSPHVPKAQKGIEYREFYARVRNLSGVGAAFAFVSSASSGFEHETWAEEDGRLSDIPGMVK